MKKTLLDALKKGDLLSCYTPFDRFVGIYRVRNKTTLDLIVRGFNADDEDKVRRIGVRAKGGSNPCKVSLPDCFNCYHDQRGIPSIYYRWSPGTPVNGKVWDEIYGPEMREAGLLPNASLPASRPWPCPPRSPAPLDIPGKSGHQGELFAFP